jgi:hypothetical protein
MGTLDHAINRYVDALSAMASFLENARDSTSEELSRLDSELNQAFENILDTEPCDNDETLRRICFLLNFIIEKADRDSIICRVCKKIFNDAQMSLHLNESQKLRLQHRLH